MKDKKEQIEAIKKIIDERVETNLGQVQGRHDNVIKTVDTVIIARDIIDAGYGDVSEYKAEIERLKAENDSLNKKISELEQDLIHADENVFYRECAVNLDEDKIKKQAQIDALNKVKERAVGLSAIETYHICNLIDKIIKEVQK